MPKEIERKFLVTNNTWRQSAKGTYYRQGYFPTANKTTVRVRTAGNTGYLTIKGERSGASRSEYEYQIPFEEAQEMLSQLCKKPLIEKRRFKVEFEGHLWEIDEFEGENQGLILAEVELSDEDENIQLPGWIGKEVTDDHRYYNAYLVDHPFSEWGK